MSMNFDAENFSIEQNETEFDDVAEDFGINRNKTEFVGPVANVMEPSVPESVFGFGWTDEDMKVWVKYGLSPAYLREMRKIEERLLGEHVCTTLDILEGQPLGACTEFAIPEVHSGIFIDEGCAINLLGLEENRGRGRI